MAAATPLPQFSVIESALRTTTERLVREIANPQQHAPQWNEFEWSVAKAACALHGISALLANRLLWQGPEPWMAFLDDQRKQIMACHLRADHVLRALNSAAKRAELPYVALKGSALREHRLHVPGERPMGDIDVLVREGQTASAARVLEELGYEPLYTTRRHDVFTPRVREEPHTFAEHLRNPLHIELHERIAEALPVRFVDITASIWPAQTSAGANRYRSFAALFRHLLLHTAGNMRANAMRFIQLYDCALLARRMGEADWRQLAGAAPELDAWWVYPPLALAERYVPGSVPPDTLAKFAAVCSGRLQRRFDRYCVYDVSWSNLSIAALPGLEWSRTPLDALKLLTNRLAPGRATLDNLAASLVTQPAVMNSRWYHTSQAQRVLRWAFTRPTRVQTMCSVRAALDS